MVCLNYVLNFDKLKYAKGLNKSRGSSKEKEQLNKDEEWSEGWTRR